MSVDAPRSVSRQVALQVLYALDLAASTRSGEGRDPKDAVAAAIEGVAENFELPPGARRFAAELVDGVVARRAELDALLAEHARNWRIDRMAMVDRNVLRLGAYELVATTTPASVVLDQAIELAHRFGDDPSPAFVNGVLDAVARSVRSSDGAGEPVARGEGAASAHLEEGS